MYILGRTVTRARSGWGNRSHPSRATDTIAKRARARRPCFRREKTARTEIQTRALRQTLNDCTTPLRNKSFDRLLNNKRRTRHCALTHCSNVETFPERKRRRYYWSSNDETKTQFARRFLNILRLRPRGPSTVDERLIIRFTNKNVRWRPSGKTKQTARVCIPSFRRQTNADDSAVVRSRPSGKKCLENSGGRTRFSIHRRANDSEFAVDRGDRRQLACARVVSLRTPR